MARKKRGSKKKVSFESRYPNSVKNDNQIEDLLARCSQLKKTIDSKTENNKQLQRDLIKAEKKLKDAEGKVQSLLTNLHSMQERLLKNMTGSVVQNESSDAMVEEVPNTQEEQSSQVQKLDNSVDHLEAKSPSETLLLEKLLETQEELFNYRNLVDKNTDSNERKVLYGARSRVEQDLPYRLGRITLQHAHTARGLLNIPSLLLKEYQKFLKDSEGLGNQPPLENYIDFEEAEKVKRHLSYRIGVPLAETIASPTNVVKLPFEVSKQLYLFKIKK